MRRLQYVFNILGCPIRTSADQGLFAPPRRFSQLTTSFVASGSQGIPHAPLVRFHLFNQVLTGFSTSSGSFFKHLFWLLFPPSTFSWLDYSCFFTSTHFSLLFLSFFLPVLSMNFLSQINLKQRQHNPDSNRNSSLPAPLSKSRPLTGLMSVFLLLFSSGGGYRIRTDDP